MLTTNLSRDALKRGPYIECAQDGRNKLRHYKEARLRRAGRAEARRLQGRAGLASGELVERRLAGTGRSACAT